MCCSQGKIRKKAKQEPIDVDDYDAGTAPLDTDDTGKATFFGYHNGPGPGLHV